MQKRERVSERVRVRKIVRERVQERGRVCVCERDIGMENVIPRR